MLKHLSKLLLSLLLSISILEPCLAKSTYYYYRQLGIKEGLSQSRVQCILNDHKGYLWIGTESGLNCYDQEHLKQYFHHQKDSASLPSNNILFIAEDSLRNLWVATMQGICLYDRANDRFERIVRDRKNLYIASYLLLDDGILLGGSGSLYKYEYNTQKLVTLYLANKPSDYTPFWEMIRYNKKQIYINTRWHGIYSYHLTTGQLTKVDYLTDRNYSSIFLDSKKRLWVSAYGSGLYCYQDRQIVKYFSTSNSALTYDVIHDIVQKDNELWVATDGGGINIISLDDFSFTNICHIQDDTNSFPANTIYRLYKDPSNNLWIGSIRNGLIGIRKVYARSFQNVPFGNPYGLSHQTINSFFQDYSGVIWIGTDGGGINSFHPATNTFKHYPSTKNEKIVSIVEYSRDELLFFSFNKGLFIFNKASGALKPFVLIDKNMNEKTCVNGFSVYIQKIANNKILFSAQKIFLYDIIKKEFRIVARKDKDYERNSPLIISTTGSKTYLADLSAICSFDSVTEEFSIIYKGNYTINDAYMDNNGIFWLATTVGLVSYNPRTDKSRWIKTELFNEATAVIADAQERIWIGTRNCLYVYSPHTEKFATLDETDGVFPNEYIFHAMALTKNQDILVGGTSGMTIIHSDIHFDVADKHTIEILDILLNGLSISATEEPNSSIKTIEIPWNFSSLQLKVLLNENDVFRKNLFRFKIEGFDQELTQSYKNSLVVNYLPIGEYTISASYYAPDGAWSANQQIVHIIVTPPWWKTGAAYAGICILCCLLVCCVIYWIHKRRKAAQQREHIKLRNKIYEDKIDFLTNISHELRTPLTLICAPLKRIIDQEVKADNIHSLLAPIYRQTYQMKSIIDMVLDVRKLEAGKMILHILPHPLNEWIHSVGNQFTDEFEAKGIELVYKLDDKIENVPFDKNKCDFILSNLLMNALKFGEPNTTVTISSNLSPEADWVRVSVKDQGVGLNQVDADSLFTDFYQGDHDKGGSGIGLSYARSLVLHHKGKIGVLPNSDKGATFYYELPLLPEEYTNNGTAFKNTLNIMANEITTFDYAFLKNCSVVAIEDTPDLRDYLKETMSNYFAHVYVAKDGKEGLELIIRKLPDVIVSDVMMPRMNGFDLCQKVKTALDISHIPVILLTAYHNTQNMTTGYKTGADAFLPKPFEIDGLLALINNLLRFREQIKTRYKEDKSLSLQDMSFSNADEAFLLKLHALIEKNMSNTKLDVAFLASNMYISRSLLFNKIKSITGMGIVDYVNKLRIEKSAILLTTTSMSITEISEAAGFSSPQYFSKVFKAAKGTIPSDFKKQF